jgi:hypothetical protein
VHREQRLPRSILRLAPLSGTSRPSPNFILSLYNMGERTLQNSPIDLAKMMTAARCLEDLEFELCGIEETDVDPLSRDNMTVICDAQKRVAIIPQGSCPQIVTSWSFLTI